MNSKPIRRAGFLYLLSVLTLLFIFGCASKPVVMPTQEEADAAKRFKKTVAIIEVTENGSPMKGITDTAFSKLETVLAGHFNLVDREKIDAVMRERNFSASDAVERYNELGKLLGADYLFFGKAMAFFNKPTLQSSKGYSDDKFNGEIWKELKAVCELHIKIIDVGTGIVTYADKKLGNDSDSQDKNSYSKEDEFNKALEARSKNDLVLELADNFGALKKEISLTLTRAMDKAVVNFQKDLVTKFPIEGQIMQILGDKEVLINLGSAYGLKPGDKIVVWDKVAEFKDPKTGLVTSPKRQKAVLTIDEVNSGLSSIAKGSHGDIGKVSVGDPVSTFSRK